jgi:hypothetical protein
VSNPERCDPPGWNANEFMNAPLTLSLVVGERIVSFNRRFGNKQTVFFRRQPCQILIDEPKRPCRFRPRRYSRLGSTLTRTEWSSFLSVLNQ